MLEVGTRTPRRGAIKLASPVLVVAAVATVVWVSAGQLDPPPGPITPTYKTLQEVEPRTPIPFTAEGLNRASSLFINAPGSYFLTSNINGVSGDTGITIDSSDVTLDLNGYSVIGVAGSLDGIEVVNTAENITIYNGVVRDWGGDGVDAFLARNCQLRDLKVYNNGGDGIRSGYASIITRCSSCFSGGDGIEIEGRGIVRGCVVEQCGEAGIRTLEDTLVENCEVDKTWGGGIICNEACTIRDNNLTYIHDATLSLRAGIEVHTRCNVVGNHLVIAPVGAADGIIVTGSYNRIDGNHVANQPAGNPRTGIEVTGVSNVIVRNLVTSLSPGLSYDIVTGNDVGPISTAAAATSPWANIEY